VKSSNAEPTAHLIIAEFVPFIGSAARSENEYAINTNAAMKQTILIIEMLDVLCAMRKSASSVEGKSGYK